jgi:hypothetical protein
MKYMKLGLDLSCELNVGLTALFFAVMLGVSQEKITIEQIVAKC